MPIQQIKRDHCRAQLPPHASYPSQSPVSPSLFFHAPYCLGFHLSSVKTAAPAFIGFFCAPSLPANCYAPCVLRWYIPMCARFMCPLPGNVTHLSFVILLRAQRMNTEGELEVKLQKSLGALFLTDVLYKTQFAITFKHESQRHAWLTHTPPLPWLVISV